MRKAFFKGLALMLSIISLLSVTGIAEWMEIDVVQVPADSTDQEAQNTDFYNDEDYQPVELGEFDLLPPELQTEDGSADDVEILATELRQDLDAELKDAQSGTAELKS